MAELKPYTFDGQRGWQAAKVLGQDVTWGQLSDAFDRVKDTRHWKHPIDAEVILGSDAELGVLREAVIFFTGSVPTFTPTGRVVEKVGPGRGLYRVRAAGYYAAVGA